MHERIEKRHKWIVLFGFVLFVLTNTFYNYVTWFDNIYYESQAVAFVCYSFVLSRYIGFIGRMVFWACIGQLFDELFGNPLEPNIWEYLSLISFFIFEGLIYKKILKW